MKTSKKNMPQTDIQDQQMKGSKISLEDQIIRNFDEVLERDEKIIKGFKPSRIKVFLSRILLTGIPCLLIAMLGLITFLIPDPEVPCTASLIIMIIALVLACVIFAISVWFICLYFKNTYYVYTNKRVIVKTGIFAVNFKSIELNNITSIDVNVSLFDKLLRKHTGTIKFCGKPNSDGNKSFDNQHCYFAHIGSPNVVKKEIKEYISK